MPVALDISQAEEFNDPDAAFLRLQEIYEAQVLAIKARFDQFCAGASPKALAAPDGFYPYIGISIDQESVKLDSILAFGNLPAAGAYATTVTRPDLFKHYLRQQMKMVMENHNRPVTVGLSNERIPLTFVVQSATEALSPDDLRRVAQEFPMPDLAAIDDAIINGDVMPLSDEAKPLSLYTAERIDYSLLRLAHYTATDPSHFQSFVLFTNYQRYVDEFISYGLREAGDPKSGFEAFVEPGNVVTRSKKNGQPKSVGKPPPHLPQMPAYHLKAADGQGITLVNIGVGPSNAKTITDHLAVLRPHCWLMVGHCGGLRRTQQLGDYVLAHAYYRADHVLDADLPAVVPVPPIAEVQVALTAAVADVTQISGRDLKSHLRTGTVFTTDDRNWELNFVELARQFNQSRAIAIDMESATIAANGYRHRVPYGTLLCVSDKPLHGEIKMRGMANKFYEARVAQHLEIGIHTLKQLKAAGVESLHSRKLRSFEEPAFR
jgi:AMP nucleosidase